MRGTNSILALLCLLPLTAAGAAGGQAITTDTVRGDFNGDGQDDLYVVDPSGATRLLISQDGVLRESTHAQTGGLESRALPATAGPATPIPGQPAPAQPIPISPCGESIEDRGQLGNCIKASSSPKLGRLFPLGPALFIDGLGNVGVNTLTPGDKLSVAGLVESLAGGLRFPDGTLQGTATQPGAAGPAGPLGPQGPPGPQGPQGQNGITALNNQPGPFLTVAGSGSASVSTGGSTITVSAPTARCTFANKTYSAGAVCYTAGNEIPCAFGFKSERLNCQANGSWQVVSSSQCFEPSAGPVCGI